MSQITIKELNEYFTSKKTGSMELFFEYNNEEFVLILYLEKQKASFQKLSKDNTVKEKYYSNINELLNEESINKEKFLDIFEKLDFYEEYNVEAIKHNSNLIEKAKLAYNLFNPENLSKKLKNYVKENTKNNNCYYEKVEFFDEINSALHFISKNISIFDYKITKMPLEEQLKLIKKFYKEKNLNNDIDKLIENGNLIFIEKNDNGYELVGQNYCDKGKRIIKVYLTGYIIDSAIIVHELSRYKNQSVESNKRTITNDLLTEAIAYAEELLFLDYLSAKGFEKEINEFRKTIFEQINIYTGDFYALFKSLVIYKKYGNILEENFRKESSNNYSSILESLTNVLDREGFEKKLDYISFNVFGYMMMIPIYLHDKNIEIINYLHKNIVDKSLEEILKFLELRYNISSSIDNNIIKIKDYIVSKKMYGLSENMLSGINIFINNKKTVYKYKLSKNKITIQLKNLVDASNLEVVYDENVYCHLNNNIKSNYIDPWKFTIDLKDIKEDMIIEFEINYKYFVKTVFKYINKFLDKDSLLSELKLLKNFKVFDNYENDINDIISEIESKSINDLLLEESNEYDRICKLLIDSKINNDFYEQLNYKDKMLIITNYIACPRPFELTQEDFNQLVESAKEYKASLESVWRLAMSYDMKNYNFDLIDNFFVNMKNIWYLGEYISGIHQINLDNIIKLIIEKKDKAFIKLITEDDFIINHIDDKYLTELKKHI